MTLIHVDEPKHTLKTSFGKAKEVLKKRPDIIIKEFPRCPSVESIFNKYEPHDKPKEIIKQEKVSLIKDSKKYPWLKGEIKILEAIEQLWSQSKQVLLFNMDAPVELTRQCEDAHFQDNSVWNYIRDRYMTNTIVEVMRKYPIAKIMIFCHNWHWKNIRFLLKNPSKQKIRKHYFGDIKNLKIKNKIVKRYWMKFKV